MFTGTLYEPQKPAAAMLCNKRRALLAWEQGTGKTVIALAAVAKLFTLELAHTALVVAPTSIAWQWQDQTEKLTMFSSLLVQAKQKSTRQYETFSTDIAIVPYSLFRRDFDKIVQLRPKIVIYDEAQEFSNVKSLTAKRVAEFHRIANPEYRWMLTGTTISTKLEQLYTIMYRCEPSFLPPWPVFEKNHIVRNDLGGIQSYKNLTGLHEHLTRRMDRKTHADMAGYMPELVEIVHKLPPSKEYKDAQKKLIETLDDVVDNITFNDEGDPQLPDNSEVRKAYHVAKKELVGEFKLKFCRELIYDILAENPSNRIVVFCDTKAPLYQLGEHYGKLATFFTGDQSTDQRRNNKRKIDSGECRLLFASNAGATGLDLPFCNYVIHLLVSPSHVIDDQRNKRITRASSVHSTAVALYLVVEYSLEEFLFLLVKRRGRLAKAVQEGTEDAVVVRPTSLRKYLKGEDE